MQIVFYTEGLPFDGRTYLEHSLGGSETSLTLLARALARKHRVRVYCRCPRPGTYDDVDYRDLSQFGRFLHEGDECDVFICSRFVGVFGAPIPSQINLLWGHDILTREGAAAVHSGLFRIDRVLVNSEFQKQQWRRALREVPEDRFVATRNAVATELAEARQRRALPDRGQRMIYVSRPERGLEVLLELWPALRQRLPQAELAIARYEHPEADARMADFLRRLEERAAALEGVEFLGALSKPQVFQELSRARLLLYPSIFPEISCMAALEAQACGTPVVASRYCALTESVADGKTGRLIPGDPRSPEYQRRFIEAVARLTEDEEAWQAMSRAGRAWAARYHPDTIAAEWEALCEGLFAAADPAAVWRHLYEQSDLEACKMIVPERVTGAEFLHDPEAYRAHYEASADEEADLGPAGVAGTPRFEWLRGQLAARPEIQRVVDVGCGLGWFCRGVSDLDEKYEVEGRDVCRRRLARARELTDRYGKRPGRIEYREAQSAGAGETPSPKASADAVLLFELLEHVPDVWECIEQCEGMVRQGGWVFVTIPHGPWESESFSKSHRRFHVRSWTRPHIQAVFGGKRDLTVEYASAGRTARGLPLGWFLIAYRASGPTGRFPLAEKGRCRPRQTVSCCLMIGGAYAEDGLHRCLKSVRPVADELLVADAGAGAEAMRIARQYADSIFEIPWLEEDGLANFAAARNRSVAPATGDWILWIDSDEYLLGGENLPKYLRDNMYAGYVIRQVHHAVDAQFRPDTPVRLYRNRPGIRFYGVVHEHPETALNEGIQPAVMLSDVVIYHDGYVTESLRRGRFQRNLPLLEKGARRHPGRLLDKVFFARDYVHLARYDLEANGHLTDRAREHLERAAALHRENFADPAHPMHQYSYPIYQSALRLLGRGLPVAYELRAERPDAPGVACYESEGDLRARLDYEIRRLFDSAGGGTETFPFEEA